MINTGAFNIEQIKNLEQTQWSLFEIVANGLITPTNTGSTGTLVYNAFTLTRAGIQTTGFKYWGENTSGISHTVTFTLWRDDGGGTYTSVASVAVTQAWLAQAYTINWTSAYTWGATDIYKQFIIGFWRDTSTYSLVTLANLASAIGPGPGANGYQRMWAGPHYSINVSGKTVGSVSSVPSGYNDTTNLYAIEPVLTVPA